MQLRQLRLRALQLAQGLSHQAAFIVPLAGGHLYSELQCTHAQLTLAC